MSVKWQCDNISLCLTTSGKKLVNFIKLQKVCENQTCYNLLKQLAASLLITRSRLLLPHICKKVKLISDFSTIPKHLCKKLLMPDSNAKVTRSPRLAAMGVAILSGLILNRRDNTMIATIREPKMRLATVAVTRLLAQSNVAWSMLKWPSTTQPMVTAAVAAKVATTIAWTWIPYKRITV